MDAVSTKRLARLLAALACTLGLAATLGLAGCNNSGDTAGTSEGTDASAEATADRADADIDWQYMTADELVEKLEAGDPVVVLDIRTDDMYDAGHIPGAYHVPCFPVDTAEEEDMLREAAPNLDGDDPVVVVCKSGNKGAKRTISVLQEEGVAADRLFILEGGGDAWDVAEWTTTEDDSAVPGTADGADEAADEAGAEEAAA